MSKTNILTLIFTAFIFILGGLSLPGVPLYLFGKEYLFRRNALYAEGTVISVERRSELASMDFRGEYKYIIQFKTAEGKEVDIEDIRAFQYSYRAWEKNDKVNVVYDPRNPQRHYTGIINIGLLLFAIPATVFGGFFIIFGIIYFLQNFKDYSQK